MHVKKPEWGPGRVLDVQGTRLTIYFRDAPKADLGTVVKIIDLGKFPGAVALATVQTDPWLDNLPIRDGKLVMTRPPLTLAGAITSFLKRYPQGFVDPEYLGHRKVGERSYKLDARQRYLDLLDGGAGEKLLAEDDLPELAQRVLRVVGAPLNLLSPSFELVPFKQGLEDRAAARKYFSALFEVVSAAVPERTSFERLIAAVEGLPSKGASTADSWPVLTLVPFLARPSGFMFLKPGVTRQTAEWLAYDLAYETHLNWRTYHQLIGMSRLLEAELNRRSEPGLHPRDFIDIQSFLWVVGAYDSTVG